MNDERPQEAYFVWANVGTKRFADFVYAFTAENARRLFAADFNVKMDLVGAFPLDENEKGVQRIMASKGFYLNQSPGAKAPKLGAKDSHPKKVGKGKGTVNKGRKVHKI